MLQNRNNLFLIFFIFIFGSFGCVAHDSLHIRTLYDSEIEQYIPQIVDICLSVYREYPEFYDGTVDEYQPIIEKYVRSSFGVASLLFDQDRLVGIAIGAPLVAKESEYDESILKQHGIDPQHFFYIAEWVVLPEYRCKGHGKQLFETLVDVVVESKKFPYICLWSTEEPENYPKPDRCFPKKSFFVSHGFIRHTLVIDLPWKDIKTQEVINHKMSLWVREISCL